MGSSVDKSLGAGLGVGTALVVVGFLGSAVLFPPAAPERAAFEDTALEAPRATPPEPEAPDPRAEETSLPEIPADEEALAADPVARPAPEPSVVDMAEAVETAPPPQEPELASELAPEAAGTEPIPETEPPSDDRPPEPRAPDNAAPTARLPSGILPTPRGDGARVLPQVTPPAPEASETRAPSAAPPAEDAPALRTQPAGTRPDVSISRLPQIGSADQPPAHAGDVLPPRDAMVTALERHSFYAGKGDAARMAVILADPGLPLPMRETLAAFDLPLTVALNPLDSSAPDAARLYRDAGKEVLILATDIPDGATASDLDVTFSAYFASVPTAVGVIDTPEGGFARNAALLGQVLPLLAQDGHGLVTFAGGLAQSARAAQAAGIAQAEVFRSLDTGDESAFTIRRFLDRAVFQASQMGHVIVFGDASNAATIEALTMWRDAGPPDQVAVVPVSGILLNMP